jgi:PPK2 family polyphosphate:nucleotide phosphotransferase
MKEIVSQCRNITNPFRVAKGKGFRLKDFDPGDTLRFREKDKERAEEALAMGVKALAELQDKLYAQDKWAVLLIFQAMDAAGKDSAIKHVMSGINPQGCQVHAFKAPSAEELSHDFLWRVAMRVPERGRIGIFNRSHYEEVLVARVHPELLERQRIPKRLIGKTIWKERFKAIRNFERTLTRNGTVVLKFFLHVSKEEQRRRFLERLDNPAKRWKFSMGDIAERKLWPQYMEAYEDMVRHTSRPTAPWFVVPADNKWFTRLVVASAIVDALDRLDLQFPRIAGADLAELKKVEASLKNEPN